MKIHRLVLASFVAAIVAMPSLPASAAGEAETPPKVRWSFAGPFGTFDRGQLQRGLRVYREVCQVCHGLTLVAFRNLAEPGGPGFSTAQAAAIAAEYQIPGAPDDKGEINDRAGRLADHFPAPFKNENEARARYNAVPPDLSVIVKARSYERGFPWWVLDFFTQYQEHGADYLHALLVGYTEPPKEAKEPAPGLSYNKYFPGHWLAMPPPLTEGRITTDGKPVYDDGTQATVDQMARDVAAFLAWAAEPHMEARKRMGLQVIVFLIVFAGLLYFTKKKVWRDVHDNPEELTPRPPTEYPRA